MKENIRMIWRTFLHQEIDRTKCLLNHARKDRDKTAEELYQNDLSVLRNIQIDLDQFDKDIDPEIIATQLTIIIQNLMPQANPRQKEMFQFWIDRFNHNQRDTKWVVMRAWDDFLIGQFRSYEKAKAFLDKAYEQDTYFDTLRNQVSPKTYHIIDSFSGKKYTKTIQKDQ